MPLKSVVDSLEGVPEALHGEYVARDGKFHLAVEGMVPSDKLSEFRNNNIAYKREIEELRKQYDGVDVEKYRSLLDRDVSIREKKLIDAGKVDELIAERVAAMKAEHDKVIKGVTSERDAAHSSLTKLLIDGALKDAGIKAGVRPEAMEDFVARGQRVFRLVDGKASAFDGDKQLFGSDSEPLSMGDWAKSIKDQAPHFFPSSSGGGTPPGGSANGGGKTMTRAQFDALTSPQAKAEAAKTMTIVD